MFLSLLNGYINNKKAPISLTLTELDELLKKFLIEFNYRIQEKQKLAPQELWAEKGFIPNMPASLEKLDLLLLTVAKPRMVRREGIYFQGLRYIDPVLASYVNENVIIRYDPSDITEIRVFHNDKYLCRPVCQELASQKISLKEIQKARNDRKKELKKTIKQRLSLVDAILQSKPKQQNAILDNVFKGPNKKQSKLKLYEADV
jgi:putative transposase